MSALGFLLLLLLPNSLFHLNIPFISASILGNETDQLALLSFKHQVSEDPLSALISWNNTIHFCQWKGVSCSRTHQRVTVLNLNSQNLVGALPPSIANLSFLRELSLANNKFHGFIPQEIGSLRRLQYLNLSQNSFGGQIPTNLSQNVELRLIEFYMNKLEGSIPVELSYLTKLSALGLGDNLLTGSIPPSLGNLSQLTQLHLSENSLEGTIPVDLGRLSRLFVLQFSVNRLSGMIPSSIYNLSSIDYFGVADNLFYGGISPDIGNDLPDLQVLLLGGNQFTGPIPVSISNASRLQRLDLPFNNFSGLVPLGIGNLQSLQKLNLGHNRLGLNGTEDLSFLVSLTNCTNLELLGLDHNRFSGLLPNTIANLSKQLLYLTLGDNQMSGSIPTGIDNLVSLILLSMEQNYFTGTLPNTIGRLPRLEELSLFGNSFSGKVPDSIGNASRLTELNLERNALFGAIPWNIGNCKYLSILDLSENKFSGTIRPQVLSLPSLSIIDFSQNSLFGPLPVEVGNLINLREFDISGNKLSGEIPNTIGNCLSLERLYLQGNFFQGPIPRSLSTLKVIQEMDLSSNNLSGEIPGNFETLPYLWRLNLSFNDLQGKIPVERVFHNLSEFSVLGNNKLCGGIPELHFPPCPIPTSKKKRSVSQIVLIPVVVSILCSLLLLFLFYSLCLKSKPRRRLSSRSSSVERLLKVSYHQLERATDGFSSTNLIGGGSYGSVYKGTLGGDGTAVAVKVFDLHRRGAKKSFSAECEALRKIRHRNLLRIITSCSSIDSKGNDFKALVFEFMPNGSLENWLHPEVSEQENFRSPNLVQRLDIATDIAFALDYLHHHCETPIVHCDLKPSNVLLDDDLRGYVGDFGLARILSEVKVIHPHEQPSSELIKGSIGYVAPEYGMGGEASKSGDVYSFGILLLEMFTGKRPTDDMFKDGLNLRILAEMVMPERVIEITDPHLLLDDTHDKGMERRTHECLVSIFQIALLCSAQSPRERVPMSDVVIEINRIKDLYLGVGTVEG